MYNLYVGQNLSGAYYEYYNKQLKEKQNKIEKEEELLESKKIYIAPGVYIFNPIPEWAKPAPVSFK